MLRSRSGRRRKGLSNDSRSADHDMAAAAGGDVAAIVGEFFSGQPIMARFFEEHCVDLFEFVPIARGRQVDFQDAGIGSDAERSQSWIGRRRIALQPHRLVQILARILDGGEQIEIVRKLGHVRQKHMQAAFSSLHAQRWSDQLRCRFRGGRESGQWISHGISLEEIHTPARARWELDPIFERR